MMKQLILFVFLLLNLTAGAYANTEHTIIEKINFLRNMKSLYHWDKVSYEPIVEKILTGKCDEALSDADNIDTEMYRLNLLGIMHDEGLCVEQNHKKALTYYTQAKGKYAHFQPRIAKAYEFGIGVPQNQDKARAIFRDFIFRFGTYVPGYFTRLGERWEKAYLLDYPSSKIYAEEITYFLKTRNNAPDGYYLTYLENKENPYTTKLLQDHLLYTSMTQGYAKASIEFIRKYVSFELHQNSYLYTEFNPYDELNRLVVLNYTPALKLAFEIVYEGKSTKQDLYSAYALSQEIRNHQPKFQFSEEIEATLSSYQDSPPENQPVFKVGHPVPFQFN